MAGATAEQRIFSLILALLTTGDQGSTKHTLLSTVYGYAEDYVWGGKNTSLERKFERDKDHLRDLGIPLETFFPYESSGNTQDIHYRIRKDVLQIPDSVSFTEDELRMLSVAALVWNEGSLSVESRRALMKLGSMTDTLVTDPVSVGKALTIPEPWVKDIRQAMTLGKAITFSYRKPGASRSRRRVAPLRLHRADGRWHLIGYDYVRKDLRTFLLSRMADDVQITDTVIDEALMSGVDDVEAQLEALQREQLVRLRVEPGSRAERALSPRGKRDGEELVLETLDYRSLAEELLAYGEDVRIIEPQVVHEHLEKLVIEIAALHGLKLEHWPWGEGNPEQ